MIDRVIEAVAAEEGPTEWWWLSFCDPTLPTGSQFLGVAVVQGRGMASAMVAATFLGINPGGEITGIEIPPEHVPDPVFRERLLSRTEAESL